MTIKGEYLYNRKCLVALKAGKFSKQLQYIQTLNCIGSLHSLSKMSTKVQAEYQRNAGAVVMLPKVISNNAKPEILRLLFRAFVRSNRATNGRQKGTVRFWLYSHFKSLTWHPERPDDQPEQSLYYMFIKCLEKHQQQGTTI